MCFRPITDKNKVKCSATEPPQIVMVVAKALSSILILPKYNKRHLGSAKSPVNLALLCFVDYIGLWQAENSCQLMKAITSEEKSSKPTTLGVCHSNDLRK